MSLVSYISSFATRVATEIKSIKLDSLKVAFHDNIDLKGYLDSAHYDIVGGVITPKSDSTKQATLVSGTNIKTINGNSLLGAGDLTIEGGGGTATGEIWTALSGTYASATTFTFAGTNKHIGLCEMSLFTCTNSDGSVRRIGYIDSVINESGTITCTIIADSNLINSDIDFKVAYNRKVTDYMNLITLPNECVADVSYPQGTFFSRIKSSSYLLPIDISVLTAASGTGASLAINIYKNTTALFSSAPALTTNTDLYSQRPTINTIDKNELVALRVTNSVGATNKASDLQVKLFIVPQSLFTAF